MNLLQLDSSFKMPKSIKERKTTTDLKTPFAQNTDLSEAADLVAEFEAPTYNETLPDLGPGFPKIQKRQGGGSFWMEGVSHGAVAIGGSPGYQVFRNVKDFGAVGGGRTDDTVAINLAISSGDRCGANCGSSTVKPALVYFPSGTYLVSKSIIGYYNTQLVGNPNGLPIIRAASSFIGLGVVSSNFYIEGQGGEEWYINQNNFVRQVRNFIIDMRAVPNNIQVIMSNRANSTHLGIFMENGSGGFMSDLTFGGGAIGAYLGNQQFTIRKLSFNDCKVAVETHWNWALSAKSFLVNNCQVGFNISASAGSVQGTGVIPSWGSGITYRSGTEAGSSGVSQDGGRIITDIDKPVVPLGDFGNWFERSKPQYEDLPASSFYDVKASGARGKGRSDDTAAINAALQAATSAGKVAYFPHGMYLVTDTIFIPPGAKVVGEVWSQIQGTGTKFSSKDSPYVMVKVGNFGDIGDVEIQDMLFGVRGGTAGAVLVQWNIKARTPGSAALWDSHWRIGGSTRTNLQKTQCPKLTGQVNPNCIAGSLLLHLTPTSSGYFENAWIWTADHDLDIVTQDQIDIYVARGVLIESQGPSWFYGTASEHSVLYQYQLQGAKNIFMGLIQTESPLMASNAAEFTILSDRSRNGFASSTLGVEEKDANGGRLWDSDASGLISNEDAGPFGGEERNRVVIISTGRDGLQGQTFWEYYMFSGQNGDVMTNMNCDYLRDAGPVGTIESPPDPHGLGNQPFKGPAKKFKSIVVDGHRCTYTTTSTVDWINIEPGVKIGELYCEEFSGPFDCFKPTPQVTPPKWETKCDDTLWFVVGVECPTREFRAKTKRGLPLGVEYATARHLTPTWLESQMRRIDGTFQIDGGGAPKGTIYHKPLSTERNKGYHGMLFYTQRLLANHIRVRGKDRPGLSDRARDLGSRVGLLTIWVCTGIKI
ncbi:hypothetical protein TWF679_005570 [Orbilia oligospora]|uniref:Rhamnogalacturonase A/B/Epimerase-like pectate lyase domain-containing protein n=1 Tax=Orbilia oligospora TaxID=2813651 RepID=A0A8H8VBV4_ORBOL|nr:hypothetical protein TWF679_005570 [Orbilia oligospora]